MANVKQHFFIYLILSLTILVSCTKDENTPPSKESLLIGSWTAYETYSESNGRSDMFYTLNIKENRTYEVIFIKDEVASKGSWKLIDDGKSILLDEKDEYILNKLDSKTLFLYNPVSEIEIRFRK